MTAVKIENRLVNSYRNTISEWVVGFRYGNFFIPRVEKTLKISPWEGNFYLTWANFWRFFQPLGRRNFYTQHTAHWEIPYFWEEKSFFFENGFSQ